MANTTRRKKALDELDYLEDIYEIYETPDFVEVIGAMGGDPMRMRVYFDANDNIKYTCEK